uniref:Uncharacterized protein n=1 Tax=Kalanchoe fedtschenkoi TaxID=63787 RepID=A0A7N0URR5_KALFE
MAQIMPVRNRIPNKASSPGPLFPVAKSRVVKLRRGSVVVTKSCALSSSSPSALVDGGDSVAALERCYAASPASTSSAADGGVVMKGQYGAFGATTLEKSKLDLSQKQTKSNPQLDVGGGGSDSGKIINFGGGDGGDDNGDDDDYFDDFDDGEDGEDGGLFRRRLFLEELFDRKLVDAVLNEWKKTMMDLPAGLRQAYEMGLVSSAQMVRFLSIHARPTTVRYISRLLPEGVSRAFNGRMMADPAFLYKLLLEQAATIGCSVWWEVKNRKHRLKQEWDLALLNVLTVTACNAFVVWTLAPCRLGLLGIKQEDGKVGADGEAPTPPKARRKRVVRKVTTRSA